MFELLINKSPNYSSRAKWKVKLIKFWALSWRVGSIDQKTIHPNGENWPETVLDRLAPNQKIRKNLNPFNQPLCACVCVPVTRWITKTAFPIRDERKLKFVPFWHFLRTHTNRVKGESESGHWKRSKFVDRVCLKKTHTQNIKNFRKFWDG